MNDPEQLNAIINTVARRMTDREAPAMRGRVMARLDGLSRAKSRDRRAARPWLVPASALAAAACAALLFVATRPDVAPSPTALADQTVVAPTRGGGPSGPLQGSSQAADIRSPGPLGPGSRADLTVRLSGSLPLSLSPDQLAWQADTIPLLERVEPTTIDSIQPAPLEVRPLTMAPLDVPAIGAEDE